MERCEILRASFGVLGSRSLRLNLWSENDDDLPFFPEGVGGTSSLSLAGLPFLVSIGGAATLFPETPADMLGARLPGRVGGALGGALMAQSLSTGDDNGVDRSLLPIAKSESLEALDAVDMVRCFAFWGLMLF